MPENNAAGVSPGGFLSGQPVRSRLLVSARPWIVVALVVGVIAASAGWWYHTTRPGYRLRRGQEAARSGDFLRAQQYADLLEAAGEDNHFHLLRAEILLRQKTPTKALVQLDLIKDEGPLRLDGAVLAAECMISLRRPRDAERALMFVLDKNPDHVDAHRWLATIYYDQGDFVRCIPHLEDVARLDPRDPRPLRMLGAIRSDREEMEEAVVAYREAIRRNPHLDGEAEVRVELALCLMKLYKEAEALDAMKGLDTEAANAVRAEALIALGRESEAVELLDRELQKHPNYVGLLRIRGERYKSAGDAGNAVRLLEKVLESTPYDFRSRTQLAQAYHMLGRSKDAELQNQKVKETVKLVELIHEKSQAAMNDPWDARIRYELGDLCEKLGREELARMWRRAAESAGRAVR